MKPSDHPLRGKRLVFLGSSVTYGHASGGESFADMIGARHGALIVKAAVSGTTLVDDAPDSYVSRLRRINPGAGVDLFICQLSTNDALQEKPLGDASVGATDVHTVAGAIGAIIGHVRNTWACPIAFYTSPRFESARYGQMVALLQRIANGRRVPVIDLWNDAAFNRLIDSHRPEYMADDVHPTRAGYLECWTPYFEAALGRILAGEAP